MAGCVDVWARFVDLTVNRKGGGVDRLVSFDYVPILVDQDQICDTDLGEVC